MFLASLPPDLDTLTIVYDQRLLRPGCALLQAAMGGTAGIANCFPSEAWLLAPTPDLQCYTLPRHLLHDVVRVTTVPKGGR